MRVKSKGVSQSIERLKLDLKAEEIQMDEKISNLSWRPSGETKYLYDEFMLNPDYTPMCLVSNISSIEKMLNQKIDEIEKEWLVFIEN